MANKALQSADHIKTDLIRLYINGDIPCNAFRLLMEDLYNHRKDVERVVDAGNALSNVFSDIINARHKKQTP